MDNLFILVQTKLYETLQAFISNLIFANLFQFTGSKLVG